jgi:hypothetical protein
MTIAMQPIYTQTVSGSSTGIITFNSIPQYFTDLQVVISSRDLSTSGINGATVGIIINGDTSTNNLYSGTTLKGTGSSVLSDRGTNQQFLAQSFQTNPSYTSNTFAITTFYIPNYTGSNFKSWTVDNVTENNATAANQFLGAGLYRGTAAVTSLSFYDGGGPYNFAAGSTFTLYGITKG